MHTSGDDTDDEVEPSPMYIEVEPVPSVEFIPPEDPVPSIESIPPIVMLEEDPVPSAESVAMEEIVRQVVGLQNIPVPNRKGKNK